jgi:hypothetical protein
MEYGKLRDNEIKSARELAEMLGSHVQLFVSSGDL